jgi:hypothetical protein
MKNKIFTIVMALFALTASAQIPKGSLFAGLDMYYQTQNGENSSTNGGVTKTSNKTTYAYLSVGPSAQYFVADNFSVGLGVGINNYKYTNENPNTKDKNTQNTDGTNFNIFARKYFSCAAAFYTYLDLTISVGSSKGTSDQFDGTTSKTTTTKNESSNSGGTINAGFAWLITERVMLQSSFGMLGFNSYTNKNNINAAGDNYSTNKSSYMNFGIFSGNYLFNLGFAYRLNK